MIKPNLAPGPTPLELLRALPAIQGNPPLYLLACARQFGDVVRFQAGRVSAVFINHPDAVRRVLQDNHRNYTKDTLQYNALAAVTGRGLLTSDGELWLRQRRLAQPAFARSRLQALGPLVETATNRILGRWDAAALEGKPVDVDREMMRLTLEVVGQALFGIDLSRDAHELTGAVLTTLDHIMYRARKLIVPPDSVPTPRNLRFRRALQTLDRTVYAMIAERRRTGGGDDLFAMLLGARDETSGEQMTDRQVRDEVITLLIAGHETVASALTWTWYLLALHPQIRDEMTAEIRGELGDRPITVNDLPRLELTGRIFDEALRLYPPAWLITRKAVQADEVMGAAIPAGTLVILSPYTLHRHPAFWGDADQFDPRRFLPEIEKSRPRYAYIPFGGGPRQCIGSSFALTEAQLILASLTRRFCLELAPGAPVVMEPLVTLRPHHGLPMLVRRA